MGEGRRAADDGLTGHPYPFSLYLASGSRVPTGFDQPAHHGPDLVAMVARFVVLELEVLLCWSAIMPGCFSPVARKPYAARIPSRRDGGLCLAGFLRAQPSGTGDVR